MNATERAVYMLETAARYINNNCPDGSIVYDEAECDGYCVADDCTTAALELSGQYDTKKSGKHSHEQQKQIIEELGKQLASARQNIRDLQQQLSDMAQQLEDTKAWRNKYMLMYYNADCFRERILKNRTGDICALIEESQKVLWCPGCGTYGDHRSGTCPEIIHNKSNMVRIHQNIQFRLATNKQI